MKLFTRSMGKIAFILVASMAFLLVSPAAGERAWADDYYEIIGANDVGYLAYPANHTAIVTSTGPHVSSHVEILRELEIYGETYIVTKICSEAISRRTGIFSIYVPDSVTTIESKAFAGCEFLMNVSLQNSETNIAADAFEGCTRLQNVFVPEEFTNWSVFPSGIDKYTVAWGNETSFTYNGAAQAPSVTVKKNGEVLNSGYNIYFKGSSDQADWEEEAVDADTYLMRVQVSDAASGYIGELFKSFTINPKSIAGGEMSFSESTTYSAIAQEPVVRDGSITSGGQAKVLVKGTGYTTTYAGVSECKNAGTYSVTVAGIGNYTGEKNVTFTVNKAPLTITAKDQTLTYNGSLQGEGDTTYDDADLIAEKVTATGLQGSDALTQISMFSQGDDVGEYDIIPSSAQVGEATGNYEITYVNGKLTIAEKPKKHSSHRNAEPAETVPTQTTKTITDANGNTATVVTDAEGKLVSVEATLSTKGVEEALKSGAPIQIPATLTPVGLTDTANAVPVKINLPGGMAPTKLAEMPRVEIQLTFGGPGVIALEKLATGKFSPIKESREGSIIFPVSHSCEVLVADAAKTFSDVKASDWYYDGAVFAAAREIFNGTGDGKFSPNASMTRGMLAQALYNFDRNAAPNSSYTFKDAAGKWYEDAASWAAGANVITGTDKGFEGEANVTREQVATILYRYAAILGYDTSARAGLANYSDADSVSGWARDAMGWAVGTKLIDGDGAGLSPQSPATRAQLATIMQRFIENVVK